MDWHKTLSRLILMGCVSLSTTGIAQSIPRGFERLKKLEIDSGITISIDEPENLGKKPMELIFFSLPNGNTTAQTFGKKLAEGDDWHFDIQHIGAQTAFIRSADTSKTYVVAYIENNLKSWPAWRRKYPDADKQIGALVQLLMERYSQYQPKLTLSGHSGGGSFIIGYLNANNPLPSYLSRIAFLDATYGYETGLHRAKLATWLKDKQHHLEIIAYNDSVVVYNGKPLVSPTGGTWYRSKLMAADLGLKAIETDDRFTYRSKNIEVQLIKNPEGKIYHTILVEKNGFIHSIFKGTKFENKGYSFWQDRAYLKFMHE